MQNKKIFILLICIVCCFGAGFLGSIATIPAIDGWYKQLIKPPLTPPSVVFGPVWTLLYFVISVSFYLHLISSKNTNVKNKGTKFFIIQLILNTAWSVAFFGMQNPLLALCVILFLWFFIFQTIQAFKKTTIIGSYLLIPYLIWVSFAAYLNFGVFFLN